MGKSKGKKVVIGVLFLAILALAAFYFSRQNSKDSPERAIFLDSQKQTESDADKNAVQTESQNYEDENNTIQNDERRVVSGRYIYSEEVDSGIAGRVCFLQNNNQPRFCFNNADEAIAVFGIRKNSLVENDACSVEAGATIEISKYRALGGDIGGYDTAILTKLISLEDAKYISCQQ